MSIESNKAVFRRMVDEVFNRGNVAVVDEIMTPDFMEREELPPGFPPGREGVKLLTQMIRSAFPDFKAKTEDMLAEGDKVMHRMTWSGTQQGEFMGVPPTGKHMSIQVIDIVRFADGKAVEHWGVMDVMGMMQQLGAIPAPGAAKA
jgi:steroid delta-isomerase-like uncharacterized protein